MLKGWKKVIGFLTLVALLGLLFAGCTRSGEVSPTENTATTRATRTTETTGTGSASAESESIKEPLKIRIVNRVQVDVVFDENNEWLKEVERRANVKLEYEAPPISNYFDRLSIIMASGDLPDLAYVNIGTEYETWSEDGLLIPLDDLYPKYPNLIDNLSPEHWEVMRSARTGKIHAVPKANTLNRWGYLINQEWLDKLGMNAPTNVEEFYELAKAVAGQDPDENGKPDTFIVSPFVQSGGLWSEHYMKTAFDVNVTSTTKGVRDVDGQFKVKERFEGYIPYLTFFRKLYAEGLMDPEFFLNKQYADGEKFLQNRIALYSANDSSLISLVATVPDALSKYSFHPPLKNSNGVARTFVGAPVWGAWAITKDAKDVDGILRFLDWGNSEEGFIVMNTGVQGIHYAYYDFDAKYIIRTPEQQKKSTTDFRNTTSISYALHGLPAFIATSPELGVKHTEDLNYYLQNVTESYLPVFQAPLFQSISQDYPDLVKKKDEYEIKYVTGEISLDEFKAFIDNEYLVTVADAEREYIEIATSKLGK